MEQDNYLSDKLESFKQSDYSTLLEPKTLCDFRINDKWLVGRITQNENNSIKIEYQDAGFYVVDFNVTPKNITYYRKHTQPISTNYKLKGNLLEHIDKMKEVIANNFNYSEMRPYEIIQLFRGTIFISFDSAYDINNQPKVGTEQSLQLFEAYLELISLYMIFLKENINLLPIYHKNREYCLVDWKFSLISFYEDALIILKKLFIYEDDYIPFYNKYKVDLCKKVLKRYSVEIKRKDAILKEYDKQNKNKELNGVCKENSTSQFLEKLCIERAYDPDSMIKRSERLSYSALIVAYINDYFYYKNGFKNMLEFLLIKDANHPHNLIVSLLTALNYTNCLINKSICPNEVGSLKAFFIDFINTMNEADIKEITKETVIGLINKTVITITVNPEEKNKLLEEMYLSYYYRCFMSKVLEKQINAMNFFNSLIEYINKKNGRNCNMTSYQESQIPLKGIEYQTLVSFFKEKKMLDLVLNDSIHEEVFKRSLNIIYMMYQFHWGDTDNIKEYSHNVINTLWKHVNEKHMGLSNLIERLMCEMAVIGDEQDKQFIYEKIKQLTMSSLSLTRDNLSLLKTITEKCLMNRQKSLQEKTDNEQENPSTIDGLTEIKEEKLFGLKHFWQFIQDDYLLDLRKNNPNLDAPEIIDSCVSTIASLLNHSTIEIDDKTRELFLMLCFENISKERSCIQSIFILKHFFSNGRFVDSYRKLLHKINSNEEKYPKGIFHLMITDLQRYLNKVKSIISESNNEDQSNVIFEGFYTHYSNIHNRINSIIMLINKDNGIELSQENFFALWECVNGTMYQDLFNQILLANIDTIDHSLLENYFNNILISNENFLIKTKESYDLFQKTFLEINKRNKHFCFIHDTYRVDISVEGEIVGINKMWSILKETVDDYIRAVVATLLCNICINVKDFNNPRMVDYWRNFINQLLDEMAEANKTKEENAVKGLLLLLKYILETTGNNGGITIRSDYNYQKGKVDQFSIIEPHKKSKTMFAISKEELFGQVRLRLSYRFDIPVNNIQLVQNEKVFDLKNDFDLCGEIFDPEVDMSIYDDTNPIVKLPTNPKKMLLKEDRLISIMIDLLHDFDKSYCINIWNFMQDLPEKEDFINLIESLGNPSDEEKDYSILMYDTKNAYYMTYIIVRIKICVLKQPPEWLEIFSKTSLYKKLLETFFNMRILRMSLIEETNCLIDLIIIINLMFSYENDEQNKTTLLVKALHFIREIFEDSYNRNESLSNFKQFCSKEVTIMTHILSFINQKNLFEAFIDLLVDKEKNESFVYILTTGTVLSRNKDVNEQFNQMILQIINNNVIKQEQKTRLVEYIIEIMLNENNIKEAITSNELNTISDNDKSNKGEVSHSIEDNFYFVLISTVIDNSNSIVQLDLEPLANKLLKMIETEKEHDITGYLTLLCAIVNYSEAATQSLKKNNDLYTLIYDNCLFSKCCISPVNKTVPKCLSKSAKKAGYRLLVSLLYHSDKEEDMFKRITTNLDSFHYLSDWRNDDILNWKITQRESEKQAYVGLKNLGCTCYLNCILQLMFMIPDLRESILSSKGIFEKKNSLFQLKSILSGMKLSESQYIDTIEFAQNFDNQSLDIREQMDVDEFLNLFIDKIENHLKNTENADLFRHFFQGINSDELIFKQGCTHNRENQINYYSMLLQVKNKKSIYESLDALIEGELMEGDNEIYCGECDKKYPAIKRQSFKVLPRLLLFGLKRFEFNYNTMTKTKLNDYYEFPVELDMSKYTSQFMKEQKYSSSGLYKLKGVVIHAGHSEGGHYYSYIKDYKSCDWFEFNDSTVRNFNIEDLKQMAYGGSESGNNQNNRREMFEKSHNAYLLLYEKEDVDDCQKYSKVVIKEEKIDGYSNIPPVILEKVNQELSSYWIQKTLFDPIYQQFILELVLNRIRAIYLPKAFDVNYQFLCRINLHYVPDEVIRIRENTPKYSNLKDLSQKGVIKLIESSKSIKYNSNSEHLKGDEIEFIFPFFCCFFFHVVLRSKDKTFLAPSVEFIKFCLSQSKKSSLWIIMQFSNEETISEFLINNPNYEARKIIVGIIFWSMLQIYCENEKNINGDLVNFINCIISIIKENKENDIQYLFFILYRFTLIHKCPSNYLSNQIYLLEFLIYYRKFKNNKNPDTYKLLCEKEENLKVKFNFLNSTLSKKVLCLTEANEPGTILEKSPKNGNRKQNQGMGRTENYLFILICKLMSNRSVKSKIIDTILYDSNEISSLFGAAKTKVLASALSNLIIKVSFGNKSMVSHWLATFLNYIARIEISPILEMIMIIFKNFLIKCEDNLTEYRVKSSIDKYIKTIMDMSSDYQANYHLNFLIKIFSYNEIKKYSSHFKSILTKLIKWIKNNFHIQTNNTSDSQRERPKNRIEILEGIIESNYPENAEYDSDDDLTDFQFVIGDIVTYEGKQAKVVTQLDETIEIEIIKNSNSKSSQGYLEESKPQRQWVETDNPDLALKSIISSNDKHANKDNALINNKINNN